MVDLNNSMNNDRDCWFVNHKIPVVQNPEEAHPPHSAACSTLSEQSPSEVDIHAIIKTFD